MSLQVSTQVAHLTMGINDRDSANGHADAAENRQQVVDSLARFFSRLQVDNPHVDLTPEIAEVERCQQEADDGGLLPKSRLAGDGRIEALTLSGMGLQQLAMEEFTHLASVNKLWLNSNGLRDLPAEFGLLSELDTLYL